MTHPQSPAQFEARMASKEGGNPENAEDQVVGSRTHAQCCHEQVVDSTMRHLQISEKPEPLGTYTKLPSDSSIIGFQSSVKSSVSLGSSDNMPKLDNDNGAYTHPVTGSASADQLADHYSEMGSSSDEERRQSDHKTLRRDIGVLARGYKGVKENNEKLKAKADSYQGHIKALKGEIVSKKNEIENLKANCESEKQAKKQIEPLEHEIAEMQVAIEMLCYGTQNKCGVCNRNCKIIDSHPYSHKVLEVVFGANYSGIFDLQQDQMMQPSSCKWKHLCSDCDNATGKEEKKFKDSLVAVLCNQASTASEKKILLSHADLFHVYTFRALFRNVDIHHYIPPLNSNPECSCSNLVHCLNDFRKRAHHLSQPFVWRDRKDDKVLIDPASAGMLFHLSHPSSADHWVEFPFICKVNFESDQTSCFLIFAQIPPFYWAFPLSLGMPNNVPHVFSEDMTSSQAMVKAHYPQVMTDASRLAKYFPVIVTKVNEKLHTRRNTSTLQERLQQWHSTLIKQKRELECEGKELKERGNKCKQQVNEIIKVRQVNQKRQDEKSKRRKEINGRIEELESKKEEACMTSEKKKILHQIQNLTAELLKISEEEGKLNAQERDYIAGQKENEGELKKVLEETNDLIKRGLESELVPKMMIGYFRTICPCYLEVVVKD